MRSLALVAALSMLALTAPAKAGPGEDATAVVTAMLDKFNAGDIDAFFAAHADDAVIVDEFAPFLWSGSGTPQRWAGDYMKDATARGISQGRVDYDAPIQVSSTPDGAYIVLPTRYSFLQDGKKMVGKGSMTFVMRKAGDSWKIASWTYSGATPVGQ